MKIPKKLKIGGVAYKITQDRNESTSFHDRSNNTININPKLSEEQKQIAFWHEVIHAANLEIKDEVLIESVAMIIFQVAKQL